MKNKFFFPYQPKIISIEKPRKNENGLKKKSFL